MTSFVLSALSFKTEFTVGRRLSTHATVIINDYLLQWNKGLRILSSWGVNVYGYDFKWRDMKKSESQNNWYRTIFLCSNFVDFWVWSVVLWVFSYTNTHAFVSPRIHCIWVILDYNVRSVNNQLVFLRPMQCFIDGQENNNLALGFNECVELFYWKKSVDKGMVSFWCVV